MVSVAQIRSFRRYFIVLSFIIAAIATPPDVVSQLALAVPMCLLYELGLWVARLIAPKSEENADAGESAERLPAQTPE